MRSIAVIIILLTLQAGCKSAHKTGKSGMNNQAKEIRNNVSGVDVKTNIEGIEVAFKPMPLFEFDKYTLRDNIKQSLDQFAVVLMNYADSQIEIRGYTDDAGDENYNKSLSEQRAKAVRDYLAAKGVSVNRMTVKGLGTATPKYPNDNEINRAYNRRVEFFIVSK